MTESAEAGAYAPDLVLVPTAELETVRRAAPFACASRWRRTTSTTPGRSASPSVPRSGAKRTRVASCSRRRGRWPSSGRILRQAPAARRRGARARAARDRRRPQLRDRSDRGGGRRERQPRDGRAEAELVRRAARGREGGAARDRDRTAAVAGGARAHLARLSAPTRPSSSWCSTPSATGSPKGSPRRAVCTRGSRGSASGSRERLEHAKRMEPTAGFEPATW